MNMDTFNKLTAPATEKIRQLQKIVQDIKKNDGSLLNKLRRLKSKPIPKVPARDYQDMVEVDEQWSEEDYDSDNYENPQEQDDSYEPPPSHKVFTPKPSASFSQEDYVDSRRNRPSPTPMKPFRSAKTTKPLPPEMAGNEEDYVNPNPDNEDDNYIDPTEKPPGDELYEVPDQEEPSPPVKRTNTSKSHESESDGDEYEVCDGDDLPHMKHQKNPLPVAPKPVTAPKPNVMPQANMQHRQSGAQTLPVRESGPKPTARAYMTDFIRPKIHIQQLFSAHRQADRRRRSPENGTIDTKEEADVYQKPWYAGACDRKTAEDALIRSAKDGTFLLRKSSGQNTQQPYTLVVLYNSRVYNIPVRHIQTTGQYALGKEKTGEELFNSVSHIIENHSRNPLVLIDSQNNTKDATKLCHAVKP
ncbi:B-cell linker protein [Lampris incognitus]|uniref:B-cell linker protein n=1 Tax=Lampris incognitus TaxID=2546036 RepID=UPI0024B4EE56|nr:B-cell linker protein [Lampris incognitus]